MQHLALPPIAEDHGCVALLGGAYSNWLALRAAVEDARARGAEAVWFLGDAGGMGPHPDRTLETLVEFGVRCVQGNYDDSVGNARDDCACGYTDPRDNYYAQLSYDYTLAQTSAEGRALLRSWPTQARIVVGGRTVHLAHGSPRRVNEFLWESTTPEAFIRRLCTDWRADLIAVTHTGLHWERRLADQRGLVNVGAVGRPANDGRPEVWYTLLRAVDGRIQTRFIPVAYEAERVARAIVDEGLPEAFAETLRTGWWTTCLEILPARERSRGRF